jgi:hypothetical protein
MRYRGRESESPDEEQRLKVLSFVCIFEYAFSGQAKALRSPVRRKAGRVLSFRRHGSRGLSQERFQGMNRDQPPPPEPNGANSPFR